MASNISLNLFPDDELINKGKIRDSLRAGKVEIEALQDAGADILTALGLDSGESAFPVIAGDNLPDAPTTIQEIITSLDEALSDVPDPNPTPSLSQVGGILTPSAEIRAAFQAALEAPGTVSGNVPFNEGAYANRLVTFDTATIAGNFVLPDPATISRADGLLCVVVATSGANSCAIEGPSNSLLFQANEDGVGLTQTKVFLGRRIESTIRSLMIIYKEDGAYRLVGAGRLVETDDLAFNSSDSIPGAALTALDGAAFPTSIDFGGRGLGGARTLFRNAGGVTRIVQSDAGKTVVHTGAGNATWPVDQLIEGSTVILDNMGGEIILDAEAQTVVGDTTVPANAVVGLRWINGKLRIVSQGAGAIPDPPAESARSAFVPTGFVETSAINFAEENDIDDLIDRTDPNTLPNDEADIRRINRNNGVAQPDVPPLFTDGFLTFRVNNLGGNSEVCFKTHDLDVGAGSVTPRSQGLIPHALENGRLVLRAYDLADFPGLASADYQGLAHLGGMVSTERDYSQKRGYWEAKLQVLNCGPGHHFSLWMLPVRPRFAASSAIPEIDMVEVVNSNSTFPNGDLELFAMNNHGDANFPLPDGDTGQVFRFLDAGNFDDPDFEGQFNDTHVFGFLWSERTDELVWYIDGVEVKRSSNWTDDDFEFYFLLTWETRTVPGDFPGPTNASTTWPAEVAVDYIRTYREPAPSPGYEASIKSFDASRNVTAVDGVVTSWREL